MLQHFPFEVIYSGIVDTPEMCCKRIIEYTVFLKKVVTIFSEKLKRTNL